MGIIVEISIPISELVLELYTLKWKNQVKFKIVLYGKKACLLLGFALWYKDANIMLRTKFDWNRYSRYWDIEIHLK